MIQVRTYLNGAWHYRWTAMAITWAICIIGWIGIAFIPNQFQAVAKVYIDTDTMMAPLLKGLTVAPNPQQQVSVMMNTLLTRPNLEQVVRLTHDDANTFSATRMANEVQNLVDNITIKPLPAKNLFEISYSNADPNRALSVSQNLLIIFRESNSSGKQKDIEGAQQFLDQKIAEYETQLRLAEQRRAEFREANLDVLSNPITPDKARGAVLAAQLALAESKARLTSLRTQLSAIPKMIYIDGPGPIVLGTSSGSYASAGPGASLLQRLAAAKQELLELQSRDTADHPDVKAAQRQVAELQRELASTPAAGSAGSGNQSVPNPVYVQTQGKLSDALVDVAFRSEQLAEANRAFDDSKKSTARSIAVSTKFANLDRDYDLLHKNYQDLLARREAARLSADVNSAQSINVRTVEPPQKAPYPVAPNRPWLNSIVLLIGLAAGLAAAVGLSINAGRFIAKEQLAAAFDYPVIGVVARLSRFDDKLKATRTLVALSASGLLLLVCYMGVLVALDATFRGTLRGLL
jgi:polysaccharide chain length determinant protein (PEP-CTERM system associated)